MPLFVVVRNMKKSDIRPQEVINKGGYSDAEQGMTYMRNKSQEIFIRYREIY